MEQAKPKRIYHTLLTPLLKSLKKPIRDRIDIDEEKGEEKLRAVATELYSLLDSYMKSSNKVMYHACCISFTLKGCVGTKKHPPGRSADIKKLFKYYNLCCADFFYNFLASEIRKRDFSKRVLPGINLEHYPIPTLREQNNSFE